MEVRERLLRGPVMRRLRRRVNHQSNAPAETPQQLLDPLVVPDVEIHMLIAVPTLLLQPSALPGRRGLRTKEAAPHVVVDADDIDTLLSKMANGLGPNQPARTCNDRDWHRRKLLGKEMCCGNPVVTKKKAKRRLRPCA